MLAPTPVPEKATEVPKALTPHVPTPTIVPTPVPAPVPERAVEVPEALTPTPAPERAVEDTEDVRPQALRDNKRAKLKVIVGRYAVNHPARLRAVLKTAPESVKPALRRAIIKSVIGYERALRAIGEEGE